jgi:Flp pilus assembly protein TadG
VGSEVDRVCVPHDPRAGLLADHLGREGKCASSSRARRGCRSEEGGSLVEFAFSVPVLLTFFFGLIQVCMASYTRAALSECAREGTRYAMVHGSTCETPSSASCTMTASAINSYVSAEPWPKIGGGTMTVNTTYPDGNENPGSRAQVAVTYTFPFRVPFVPTSTLTMSSTSVMYIVQ